MNATAQAKVEPGVYSGIPEDEYFGWPAVSNSRLTPLLKSPQHCLYAMEHPSEPTSAMTLGSAVDTLVFSPTLFSERFAVAEQCNKPTQKHERCKKRGVARFSGMSDVGQCWYCSQHTTAGDEIRILINSEWHTLKRDKIEVLTPDQFSTAYAMAKAVHDHPCASVLLAACEEFQLSLVWRENTLLCKGRLDGLSRDLQTIIDLKTCADASPEAFSRKVADFGYHRQAAMYMRGATFHGINVKNFIIIAVESEPPHAVALYTLTERPVDRNGFQPTFSPVEYGNHQLTRLLDLYEQCETTSVWPGYSERPEAISLPKWAEYAIERG